MNYIYKLIVLLVLLAVTGCALPEVDGSELTKDASDPGKSRDLITTLTLPDKAQDAEPPPAFPGDSQDVPPQVPAEEQGRVSFFN